MFWLLVVATVSVLLPTFLKVYSVGQNAALGRVPVKLPLVVSQIRIRSIGEHVNVVVFRLIAIGTWPLISSIPVGLVTLTPASLKRPVSRTLPRAAVMAAVLVPRTGCVPFSVESWSMSTIGPIPLEPPP